MRCLLLLALCSGGSAWAVESVEAELVSGPAIVRSPGDPAAGDRVTLKLKGDLARAIWDAMEGAEQRGRKRRGTHALASRANLFDPVVVELRFVRGELVEIEDWELFHGFTPWVRGRGTLTGERLLIEGEPALLLGGEPDPTALVELVALDLGAGEWSTPQR